MLDTIHDFFVDLGWINLPEDQVHIATIGEDLLTFDLVPDPGFDGRPNIEYKKTYTF